MKIINFKLCFIITILPVLTSAQHFRDNFLGTYNGTGYRYYQHVNQGSFGTVWMEVTAAASDTGNILITTVYVGGTYTLEYVLHNDSTFEEIQVPTVRNGKFYDTDSLFVYYNDFGASTNVFYGRKSLINVDNISSPILEVILEDAEKKLAILNSSEIKSIEIYSISGKLQYAENYNSISPIEIDRSKFETGIYLLKLDTSDKSVIKKILVQ